ncbi:stimulated by retinoic acid gene 6 protein-like [Ylistrum balloti]|uniref:stimulated by retinoic acid gene 6 protein-like n=1 Tax=Ylistrum balloti TaxID=509963 RepID=UPI002905E3AB|nr:stimulated by retinoic acid gene 6 protein-like [Ylistrum balloti]
MSFLTSFLLDLAGTFGTVNTTDSPTTTEECNSEVADGNAYNIFIVPAVLEILFLAFTIKRTHRKLECCGGKPGLVSPMDIFEMEHRISYTAAFGSIAFLCSEVILESKYVITYNGPGGYRVFVIILSVIVYGIACFPLFVALSLRSVFSYGFGTLHVWGFTVIAYYETFACSNDYGAITTTLLVLRIMPKLVCLTYLSVVLPVRFVKTLQEVISKPRAVQDVNDTTSHEDKIRRIRKSIIGRHIQKNFMLPRPKKIVVEPGIKGKLRAIIKPILKSWIYKNNPEFKYSSRFLSTVGVSFIIVYKLTVEILIIIIPTIDVFLQYLVDLLETNPSVSLQDTIYMTYYLVEAYRSCIIAATVVECVLAMLILLHIISSYRKYLLALHKGITHHIPAREDGANARLVVGTMRYSGYQVGYTTWSYFIQWCLLLIFCMVVATVIILYQQGYGYLITNIIVSVWSIPVTTLIINIAQTQISKFVFLQEKDEVLALDNRRGFFIFTYFMFYYNIFLGLVSCLLRIIKSIILGALFLGRLDHSTLPRRFQLLDPGFDAFVGFLHMENAHRHPVVLAFISILQVYVPHKDICTSSPEITTSSGSAIDLMGKDSRRKRKVHHRWHLFYTLHNNPNLRTLRKRTLKAFEEKLQAEEELRKARKRRDNLAIYGEPEVVQIHLPEKEKTLYSEIQIST